MKLAVNKFVNVNLALRLCEEGASKDVISKTDYEYCCEGRKCLP